jgi:hypothetical protein
MTKLMIKAFFVTTQKEAKDGHPWKTIVWNVDIQIVFVSRVRECNSSPSVFLSQPTQQTR